MRHDWSEADRPILMAGPTASGKSALALDLAERLGGTVINADSMQVYGELRILTARPPVEDEARAPHLLYGHVSLRDPYSAGRWLADVDTALAATREAGRRAIVVGGTGLYFRSLTRGISEIPPVPEDVRRAVRARLEAEGGATLHEELAGRDPEAASRIPPTDPQRIVRALEVLEATGRRISEWQKDPPLPPLLPAESAARLVLTPERDILRARIARRTAAMLEQGAVDEARAVAAMKLDPELPGSRVLGLKPLVAHVRGEAGRDATEERIRVDTNRYAKRQSTWFRTQMADWPRAAPEEALEAVLGAAGI